ncbi:MAG: CotH kinase family protein [Planctomycetes bacterium]|nr:CotH kinase family protein [Planctomycetota bacterium]
MTLRFVSHCGHVLTAILAVVFVPGRALVAQDTSAVRAKAVELDTDTFYRIAEIQTVHLRVTPEDRKRMLAALPERIYVRASFQWRDVTIDNVSIRFKGNSSSSPTQQHKRSYLVKFDEYSKDQRFLGLQRISLDNGVQFGSLFSEPIITEILRDQGLITHRCNYAKLFLNDEYQGVYINVERIDQSFLENHLPDPEGMLFKVDEGGPGANLQFLGDDPAAYERTFEPETKSAKRGRPQLVQFIKQIQTQDPAFAEQLAKQMELDDFLKVTAVLLFSGAFDQLTGWNPHNYYLYRDGNSGRWRYLPWDLDVGFCERAFGQINVLADWNAAWPAPGQLPNPLLDRIVADPVLLQKYRDTARVILDKSFEPDRLCAVVDARYALIKADLKGDPFPHRRVTNPEDRSYDDIVASIKQFIRKRHATARQQLENPGKRPAMSRPPEMHRGPPPQLVGKIQRVQRVAEQMRQNGKDLQPLHKIMQQVGPLLQQGKFDAAENLIGEALKVVGEDPGTK